MSGEVHHGLLAGFKDVSTCGAKSVSLDDFVSLRDSGTDTNLVYSALRTGKLGTADASTLVIRHFAILASCFFRYEIVLARFFVNFRYFFVWRFSLISRNFRHILHQKLAIIIKKKCVFFSSFCGCSSSFQSSASTLDFLCEFLFSAEYQTPSRPGVNIEKRYH